MGQGLYKIGQAIEITYQATKAQTGLLDVTMVIYDEGHAIDAINFPDVVMTEIGTTGRYYGAFTPDVEGEWTVLIDSVTKSGKVVKKYSVTAHNIDSVGDDVVAVDGKVDGVDVKVDTAIAGVSTVDGKVDTAIAGVSTVDGKVDAVDGKVSAIRGVDNDTLKTLSDQIDNVANADSAPMIG